MPLENSGEEMGAVFLRLENLARLENDLKRAKEFYERAEQMSGRSLLSLQAQINLFSLLIESEEKSAALEQRSVIAPVLSNLTTSRDNIFARINYSESLLKLTKLVSQTEADLLLAEAAKNLALSRQQAREIKDNRTLAYAIGSLGSAYEQSNQIEESQKLTQQALAIAQSINASDIAYRWQ